MEKNVNIQRGELREECLQIKSGELYVEGLLHLRKLARGGGVLRTDTTHQDKTRQDKTRGM
jgi:hypothetical protein